MSKTINVCNYMHNNFKLFAITTDASQHTIKTGMVKWSNFFFICVTPKFNCSFFVCVKELVYIRKYLFVLQPQTVCVKKLNSKKNISAIVKIY